MPEPIAETLELMERCTPLQRDNIRNIYLAQFGKRIIPYCIAAYERSRNSAFRKDMLRFLVRYARESDEVVAFAIRAISDRSQQVTEAACAVLAYSFAPSAVPPLRQLAAEAKEPTATNARNALLAIAERNHNLYYPRYHTWAVALDDPTQPRDDAVQNFIEKPFPSLVPELVRIFGSTRGPYKE